MSRAPFNTTCDIVYGLHGAFPGVVRGSGPCRLVAERVQIIKVKPLHYRLDYVTLDVLFPGEPVVSNVGGLYTVDYDAADLIAVPSGSTPKYQVMFVETVTYLSHPVYYRAHVRSYPSTGGISSPAGGVLLGLSVASVYSHPYLVSGPVGGLLLGLSVSSTYNAYNLSLPVGGVLLGLQVDSTYNRYSTSEPEGGLLLGLSVESAYVPGGDGPERWYKFLEGSGSNLHDSISAQDGTISSASWSTDSPTIGYSLSFSNSGGGVVVVPHITGISDWSVFGRVKIPSTSSGSFFQILGLNGSTVDGWAAWVRASFGQFKLTQNAHGNASFSWTADNAWHSYGFAVSGSSVTGYFDGVNMGTVTQTPDIDDPGNTYWMGKAWFGGGTSTEGFLTDVRYWVSTLGDPDMMAAHLDTGL